MKKSSYWSLPAAFLLGGLVLPNLQVSWGRPANAAAPPAGLALAPAAPSRGLDPAEVYARAAQSVYRSVVNLDTTQRVRTRGSLFEDDFQENQNEGSGVIIDRLGHILTNEHVVGRAGDSGKKIVATLPDGRRFNATIVGADRQSDVALLKVNATDLVAAPLGTGRGLVPGQMAIAIGNPFGLRFTVNHGVVSALGRPISRTDGRVYADLIQHDAFINPGNSGGALVNLQGQVIGINTLVDTRAQGIGFAIPIDTALRVADELKRSGRIKRAWLGAVVDANSAYYIERYGVADVAGVVVRSIYRGGPASEAGVEPGDVITRLDNQPLKSAADFQAIERTLKLGQTVEAQVRRGDDRAVARIKVGESP